jgi:hypothetical protein
MDGSCDGAIMNKEARSFKIYHHISSCLICLDALSGLLKAVGPW